MKNQRKWLKRAVLGLVLIGVISVGVGTSLYLTNNKPKEIKSEYENKEQDKENNENIDIDNVPTEEQTNETTTQEESTPQEEISPKQEETPKRNENSSSTVTTPKTESPQVQKPVVEQPKPKTPWEELGISEYDYYNKPDTDWQTVDIDINEYSSYDEAKNACYEMGANRPDLGRYKFRCDDVHSRSGKLLGFYIKYTIY